MPTAADKLTIHSSKSQQRQAVSDCISQIMRERPNMAQAQAVAI